MFRYIGISAVVLCSLIVSGCAASRVSTTTQTAVEQALLSFSAEDAVSATEFTIPEAYQGATYFLDAVDNRCGVDAAQPCAPVESKILLQQVEGAVLRKGLLRAAQRSEAKVLVQPVVDYAAMDDSDFLIGLPSIPLPIPGVAALETPELPLLALQSQWGRTSLRIRLLDAASGALITESARAQAEQHYNRWRALIFFGWRTTSLEEPF